MRQPLVVGNWKMHGSRQRNEVLLQAIRAGAESLAGKVDLVVCPPYVYLEQAGHVLAGSSVALGAQDLCAHPEGSCTGAVSAEMLADLGCGHVIVGHSERRAIFAEDDRAIAEKFEVARQAGLVPILCVGEQRSDRDAGRTAEVLHRQLAVVIERVGIEAFQAAAVAYEPVWAIGAEQPATPDQVQDAHQRIREQIAGHDDTIARQLPILYGGSMKAANAPALLALPDVDGGLLGRASLDAEEFLAVAQAAVRAKQVAS